MFGLKVNGQSATAGMFISKDTGHCLRTITQDGYAVTGVIFLAVGDGYQGIGDELLFS